MKKILSIMFVALLLFGLIGLSISNITSAKSSSGSDDSDDSNSPTVMRTYEDCVNLGGEIQETAPPRCVYAGETYIQGKNIKSSKFTKFVYGFGNVIQISLDKYKAHCESVGGTFNSCGSFCEKGVACVKACAIVCENVPVKKSDKQETYKIKDNGGKYELEYKDRVDDDQKIEYKMKYNGGDESNFESDYELKGMSDNKLIIAKKNGDIEDLKILPDDAVKNVFGDYVPSDKKVKLEEKSFKNVPRVVYNIEGNSNGRFLGIFKIKARYNASVDAVTGDVLYWKGPWWAFLVTGKPSKPLVKDPSVGDVKVVDYDSCVKVTGVSTDGIPSECTYKGKTYVQGEGKDEVKDFDSCVAAGYPVMESYPRQCRASSGAIFVEIIKNNSKVVDYETCVAAGNPIQETAPPRCMTSEGKTYVKEI